MDDFFSNLWSSLGSNSTSFILKLIAAILILILGIKLTKWTISLLKKGKWTKKIDPSVEHFTMSAVRIALYILVITTAAITLGIPSATLVTLLGSAGLAVGLALQGSLSNLAGSIMILFFKPFRIGDYISGNGIEGTVDDINFFYTVLITPDNKKITVPNGSLSNSNITNYSAKETRRVDFTFNVAYGSDTEKARAILLQVAKNDTLVLQDPVPFTGVISNGDSSIDIVLRVWSKTTDYWTVYFNITELGRKELENNGIEIPFPQMDVHVKQ